MSHNTTTFRILNINKTISISQLKKKLMKLCTLKRADFYKTINLGCRVVPVIKFRKFPCVCNIFFFVQLNDSRNFFYKQKSLKKHTKNVK